MRLRSVSNWSSMSNSLICIHVNGYLVVAVLLHFPYAKSTESFHFDAKWNFTVSLTYDGSSKENVPVMIQLMWAPSCPTTFLSVFRITWILKDKKIYSTLIPVSHSHCYRHLSYCCLHSFCHIQSLSYLSTLFPFLTLCFHLLQSFPLYLIPLLFIWCQNPFIRRRANSKVSGCENLQKALRFLEQRSVALG